MGALLLAMRQPQRALQAGRRPAFPTCGGQHQARLLCPLRAGSRETGPVGRKRRNAVEVGAAVTSVAAKRQLRLSAPALPSVRICGSKLGLRWGLQRALLLCSAAAGAAQRTCAHCRTALDGPSAPTSRRVCRAAPPSSCSSTNGPPSSC